MRNSTSTMTRVPSREIVGVSPWTRQLQNEIQRVAPHSSSVLITGPSGTGKELIARAIHAQSSRKDKPFVPVDCASLTGSLLASQLFGHRAGSFTGATYSSLGCFRSAEGGTIFLDEVGELELEFQSKLLRVLQERVVMPLGSHDSVPVDVRIVAATNRNLKREIVQGGFRQDLYFRLSVVDVETVPLCERIEDIPVLANHMLHELAENNGLPRRIISPEGIELLSVFRWPGNVRQLNNVLEQAVILSEDRVITLNLLQRILRRATLPTVQTSCDVVDTNRTSGFESDNLNMANCRTTDYKASFPEDAGSCQEGLDEEHWMSLADLECNHIRVTLERTYHNQSAAARLLQISRQALIRKMKRYGIETRRCQ